MLEVSWMMTYFRSTTTEHTEVPLTPTIILITILSKKTFFRIFTRASHVSLRAKMTVKAAAIFSKPGENCNLNHNLWKLVAKTRRNLVSTVRRIRLMRRKSAVIMRNRSISWKILIKNKLSTFSNVWKNKLGKIELWELNFCKKPTKQFKKRETETLKYMRNKSTDSNKFSDGSRKSNKMHMRWKLTLSKHL